MMTEKKALVSFVCTGNICRSPMAEYLFRDALTQSSSDFSGITVVSCGIAAMKGQPASPNAQRALGEIGLDLSAHQSRPVDARIAKESLVLFCMTQNHKRQLQYVYGDALSPIVLIRQHLDKKNPEVPDPFGLSLAHYIRCRDAIIEAIPSIVDLVKVRWLNPKS